MAPTPSHSSHERFGNCAILRSNSTMDMFARSLICWNVLNWVMKKCIWSATAASAVSANEEGGGGDDGNLSAAAAPRWRWRGRFRDPGIGGARSSDFTLKSFLARTLASPGSLWTTVWSCLTTWRVHVRRWRFTPESGKSKDKIVKKN